MSCGWLRETFLQYLAIHGLDKFNTVLQNVTGVLHQNKPHIKILLGLQFGRPVS